MAEQDPTTKNVLVALTEAERAALAMCAEVGYDGADPADVDVEAARSGIVALCATEPLEIPDDVEFSIFVEGGSADDAEYGRDIAAAVRRALLEKTPETDVVTILVWRPQ